MSRMDATSARLGRRWKKRLGWLLGSLVVLAVCLAVRYQFGPDAASAQAPPRRGQAARAPARPGPSRAVGEPGAPMQIMAVVNNREIGRQALANACVERYGKVVLEGIINQHLIAQYCQKQNVIVTREEIDQEIDRFAKKMHIDRDHWLEMLEKDRGITPEQYAREILWPTLALRKLASDRLTVSPEELQEAREREYGEAVRARLIVVDDHALAERLHAQLVARPDDFEQVARQNSMDSASASLGGWINPIRRHMGDAQIEETAFGLAEGAISPIVRVAEQYVILKCEGRIAEAEQLPPEADERLTDQIRERKLRTAGRDLFRHVKQNAVLENVYENPQLHEQRPGVVAIINGQEIPMRELADACLRRHGKSVLEGEINRALLEQELEDRGLKIAQDDLDAEIAHAATLAGVLTTDGQPDLRKWIEQVTSKQGISQGLYLRDVVWPSAALKQLVRERVEVTQQDVTKGIEANYGPRVRCRVIVMDNLRRAQQVWEKARQQPTPEAFGELAAQYSIEPTAQTLRGEVPPIRHWGGQPLLEEAAFALSPEPPDNLSGVIQVGDKFVILLCEGYTKPIRVDAAEVEALIRSDIHEKKLRIEMAKEFETLREDARIDNYLAGTSQSPKRSQPAGPEAASPIRQIDWTDDPRPARGAEGPPRR